jgi:WD repeat-containing protein 19
MILGVVQITDRFGEILHEIPMAMNSPILALSWDKDGEYLAILQDGNGVVPLWSLSSKKVIPLETNLKDPTFLEWSKSGSQLAIGTAKGNLLIYNKITKKKVPLMGKHSKKILCGAWSLGNNRLALGSDDKHITISNDAGETLLHAELRSVPYQLLFTYRKTATSSSAKDVDNTVSAIMDGKSILLHNVTDESEDPLELTFAQRANGSGCKYGDIINHYWMDENMLLVGFSGGTVLLVSTGQKDLGEEKFSVKFHPNNLITFAYNPFLKRCASAGDDGVRIFDVRDFKESEGDFIHRRDLEDGRISEVAWSPDGQILTVGTNNGNIYNFLAKMSSISAKYKASVAYLSSLREASILDVSRRSRPIDITFKLEPSMIALGVKHIAAAMNNRVYYHKISSTSSSVIEQEYIGTVHEIQLNEYYTAVLTDDKALVHPIDIDASGLPDSARGRGMKTFPSREEGSYAKITCMAITDEFFYFGTAAGTVEIFYLNEWVLLSGSELRLKNPIKGLYPNHNGTRVIVTDTMGQVFLYNPVLGGGINQSIIQFELIPTTISSIIWDQRDRNVIMIFDGMFIHTYVYTENSVKGSVLVKLGPMEVSGDGKINLQPDKVELIAGNIPLISIGGVLTCQSASGALSTIVHPYFDHIDDEHGKSVRSAKRTGDFHTDKQVLVNKFCQTLALCKLEMAWVVALQLDRRQFYLALSGKAMELLNVELACRVYRQLGDAGKVMALQDLIAVEDKLLLAGHIALLFDNYMLAQELYLASSQPSAALDMRCDLLQWDQALKIAEALNFTSRIPEICIKYGQQVEFRNDIELALRMYETAINTQDESCKPACPEALIRVASGGIGRCQLRLGNIRQGLRLISDLDDLSLYIECGEILEQQKQYSEAATIYLKANQYEKVAFIYTKYLIKNDKNRITEIASIMEKVQNDQLNSTYAKLCVSVGKYEEAAKAYERAKDTDKVVEIKLRYLDQIQQAFDLVRESASAQGAQIVAEYCLEINDVRGAIEFLLIANKVDEAFKLAQDKNVMETYCNLQGENISSEDALKVAHYYEKSQDFGNAGRYALPVFLHV